MATTPTDQISEAIDTWYSAHYYASGVRLTATERALLAKYIAQKLGLAETGSR